MCGITGFIGYKDAYTYLYFGLQMLQNRGYDSAGIATINSQSQFLLQKYASDENKSSIDKLSDQHQYFKNSSIGCCHTRWATHGAKTDLNAHPHLDYTGNFCIVHNGIIENYQQLKDDLKGKGVTFKTQTDTEVIANQIGYLHQKGLTVKQAISETLDMLEGTYGLVILTTQTPDKLYCARHGSPILIGFSQDEKYAMISSEQSGFYKYVNHYICLDNSDVVVLSKVQDKIIVENDLKSPIKKISTSYYSSSPDPYPHWTIKEIYEQSDSVFRAMGMGGRLLDDSRVNLGGLERCRESLLKIEHLIILGCGTSYHSGLHSISVFREITNITTCQLFDGAYFNHHCIPKKGKVGIILLSQSGETRDLYRCLEMVKNKDVITIGVINVVDSLIARETDCGVYINAGREVAVASTKAFTNQVVVLYLIAIWFSQHQNVNIAARRRIIRDLRKLPGVIKTSLKYYESEVKSWIQILKEGDKLFILGKGLAYSIAKEGALKIKEISYLHCEGYESGALKHGTYSLIEPGTPIISLIFEDKYKSRNQSVVEEVNSRGATSIIIDDEYVNNQTFKYLLSIIPLQLIAYHLSVAKGYPVDTPRNLAKVVTTD